MEQMGFGEALWDSRQGCMAGGGPGGAHPELSVLQCIIITGNLLRAYHILGICCSVEINSLILAISLTGMGLYQPLFYS